MIRQEDIKEILNYITLAMTFLGYSENKIDELTQEVEREIRIYLTHDEKRMRNYVEDAYNSASFIYSTGHSLLFYKRHDRQPVEMKFGFSEADIDWIRQNKVKYVTEVEFDIIRERLNADPSKKLCDTRCYRFWRSEENADQYHVPVTFYGENPDYCDKSISSRYCELINRIPK